MWSSEPKPISTAPKPIKPPWQPWTVQYTIDAWFCANDLMALGVSDAYTAAQSGQRPVIVGVDLIEEARNAIASGCMDASVAFSRTEVARHVLAAAADVINDRKPSTAYGVKSVLVTPG